MRYTEILVERGLNANDLVKHGDDRLNLLLQKISNGNDFVRRGNAGTVKIDPDEADKIETAIPLNPSDLILFRAEDKDKNLAILVIHGLDSKKKTAPNTPMELTLSFQKDSINPDIFEE